MASSPDEAEVAPAVVAAPQSPTEAEIAMPKEKPRSWWMVVVGIIGVLACLYVFLVGLQLLGDGFQCLGGKGAGGMFNAVSNPIAGLMVGILATVLVQSSSTSTSIVVGLVGAGQLSVHDGIPIIMGANIGTSVTNTIVSMGQSGDRIMLQRAFAGATVHDMFNFLTVLCLLPIEVIIGAIEGEGGPLYWITKVLTDAAMDNGEKSDDPLKDKSPVKIITDPLAKVVISNDKYIINALALGAPAAIATTVVNSTAGCAPLARRLDEAAVGSEDASGGSRRLVSRSLSSGALSCSEFYCVGKDLDKNFKSISSSGYKEKLTKCKGYISSDDLKKCGKDACYLNAGKYFTSYVEERPIIKGGFVQGAGDAGGGIIALILSLLLLTGGLMGLCKILKYLFLGAAKKAIIKATRMNDYAAILVGVVMTVIVQSSSVTTSALTPLCGVGALSLEKMLPLTLGANIGTTATALIASLSSYTHGSIHIALCHLFFNVIGILIWFPVPIMRRVPLGAARLLGLYASYFRLVPLIYIILAFVIFPGIFLGISAIFDASIPGGIAVLVVVLVVFAVFEYWWIRRGGCYKVLPEEARQESQRCLEQADREVRGEGPALQAPQEDSV